MASAFIGGLTEKGSLSYGDVYIYDIMKEKAQGFLDKGANWCDGLDGLAQNCRMIFLCVKPQQIAEPLANLATVIRPGTVVVSMLAGKSIAYFQQVLGEDVHVIRIMPNTPLLLGCGATAVSTGKTVTSAELDEIMGMIGLLGQVALIPEEQMDAIVAVNGSSPAYFYLFVKAMVDWAVEKGIDPQAAISLATQSMLGSARMLAETGKTPEQLICDVSSPGGTTLAALHSFEQDGVTQVIARAMSACEKRSKELTAG